MKLYTYIIFSDVTRKKYYCTEFMPGWCEDYPVIKFETEKVSQEFVLKFQLQEPLLQPGQTIFIPELNGEFYLRGVIRSSEDTYVLHIKLPEKVIEDDISAKTLKDAETNLEVKAERYTRYQQQRQQILQRSKRKKFLGIF